MRSSQCQGPSHQGLSKVLPKKPNRAGQSCLANARASGGPVATPSPPCAHHQRPILLSWEESCSAGRSPAQLGPVLLSWDESCSAGRSPAQLGRVLLSWDESCSAGRTCRLFGSSLTVTPRTARHRHCSIPAPDTDLGS